MDVVTEIDKARRAKGSLEKRRGHLGASQLGSRCARQIWYGFRWVYSTNHLGRIQRLFDRGHEEEARFNRYLRLAGYEVQDFSQRLWHSEAVARYLLTEWDDKHPPYYEDVSSDARHIALASEAGMGPKQWNFVDGHFSGSSDGRIRGEGLPDGWGLLECKTHSEKSFTDLSKKGVLSSKATHYVQMQIYMRFMGLRWGLYLAVNKNNDELYAETIYYKEEVAEAYIVRAQQIIAARQAPPRLTEDPSWFECKFCDFREICHYSSPVQKNCRSCAYAEPTKGQWYCNKHKGELPPDFIPVGCDEWESVE